jgi:hypothetical protein
MKGDRRFYIYALLDPLKPGRFRYGRYVFNHEPFYVGKGTRGRELCHFYSLSNEAVNAYNKQKRSRIKQIIRKTGDRPLAVKIHTSLLEASAYKKEVEIIALIGRSCAKEGPLLNRSAGGKGGLGVPRKPVKLDVAERIAESNRKAWARKTDKEIQAYHERKAYTIANRARKHQSEISRKNAATAANHWKSLSDAERKKFLAKRRKGVLRRMESMTPEYRIRFNLKKAAGRVARKLGVADKHRKELRSLIGEFIDSMKLAAKELMLTLVTRKMARLVVKYGY